MNKRIKSATLCILAAGLLLPVAMAASSDNGNEAAIARNLDTFNTLYKELNTFYVDTIDTEKSIQTAINAMLGELDPYTEYLPASEQEDFRTMTTGEYGGIGSYIMQYKDSVLISEPYEDSPAARAGLIPGDVIIKIDNDSTIGWTSEQVSNKLKGQANSTLQVVVSRPYVGELTFNITREKIRMNSVPYYGVVRDSIGYIALSSFTENSPSEVREALLALKKEPGVKSIVLDLRGNPGGILESAVQIVGMFVPKGTQVLQQRGRVIQNDKTYKTTQDPIDDKIPLVVFIDGASASASEITSGALQDLDRAVVIGFCLMVRRPLRSTRPLPFDGILKVTIAKYYIPSGRLIQAIDYSHRNPDGSVARIPDSLTTVFKTAHGREVRDGGGITPDIKVEYPEMTRLYFNIVRDNWAFNYATRFAHEHDTIASPEEFVITDSIYADFKKFIDPSEFKYDKVCEDGLEKLKKVAEVEGYMNDSTRAQFDVMAKLLKHDLNKDLDTHRKEISGILAMEILKRYYYQRGQAIESLKNDVCLDEVVKLFGKPGEYYRILNIEED